ncbi:MAG TPA: hypothetical protein VFL60_04445 [Gaiellaceae bacterium]|nr:hypothetical protein [Gaiellaceae bacterium]
MAEFALFTPDEAEISDAVECLDDILRLDEVGEIDLPPYLTKLLVQLEETLVAVRFPPAVGASA